MIATDTTGFPAAAHRLLGDGGKMKDELFREIF